ncbi:putative RNA-directed DNA polymerase [Helianthus annuus]|nr:putative RNA-directed DNA polymerase [Helianthus annuus]
MVSPDSSSSTKSDATLPMATLLHMLTIKLSSTNYLVWRYQVFPLLSHQKLAGYVDGTIQAPEKNIITDGAEVPNPDYSSWLEVDQRVLLLLQSSLTEEAIAEAIGHTTARSLWMALESAYSNASVERTQTLRDSLRQLRKGTSSVADFGKKFKSLCDQLSAIGHPVPDMDKTHWFLCGLGPAFETFSTAHRALYPPPPFRDLMSKAESHELFLASLNSSTPPQAAFITGQQPTPSNRGVFARGRGRSGRLGTQQSGTRGRGKRIPHCQLCRHDGHYAPACPSLSSFAQNSSYNAAHLAEAFHAHCNVSDSTPDWCTDTGATSHMAPSTGSGDKEKVGNRET